MVGSITFWKYTIIIHANWEHKFPFVETEEKATDDASGESNDSDTDGEEVPETASDDGQESPKTTVSSTAAADDDAAAQAKGGSKRIPIADRVVHEPAKNAPKIIQVAAPPQMAVEVDYVDLTSAIVDARSTSA